MSIFLLKTGYHKAEADPDTGEIIRPAGNDYRKVVGELDELRDEYVPIRLNGGTKEEVTVLLKRGSGGEPWLAPFRAGKDGEDVYIAPSQLDPLGLVSSFCSHGPATHPTTGAAPNSGGRSWVPSHHLTLHGGLPPQVKCHCTHAEDLTATCLGDGWGGPCPVRARAGVQAVEEEIA